MGFIYIQIVVKCDFCFFFTEIDFCINHIIVLERSHFDKSLSVLCFQSGSTQHVMVGVQLLSQLVCEMNQVSEVI